MDWEKRALLFSAGGNVLIGIVGVIFALLSKSQAILLDGLFNLTYLVTGLFTLKVANLVRRGDNDHFPMGYGFFEPLINGIKGMLVLGVSVVAFISAAQALLSGGRSISTGLATGYGVFATIACLTMAIIIRKLIKKTNSPLVRIDGENWMVNAAISSAVLLAFIGIFLVQGTRYEFLAKYIDPALVIVVVIISISIPVRMAWQSLLELLNRAPSRDIVAQVKEVIVEKTGSLPVEEVFVRVIQPGRSRMVLAHVILPIEFQPNTLVQLDDIRDETLTGLKRLHLETVVDLVFTSNRYWGLPVDELNGQ